MLLERENNGRVGTCSLNCAAVDYMSHLDHLPDSIKVGDYRSKKIIDAVKAYWVIGGNKSGVMTERAKWAFEKKSDAEAFIRRHGGQPATFEEAVRASFVDMYTEMKLIERRRSFQRSRSNQNPDTSSHP
jgi:nitrous oxide reductase accessory protein NosL